MEQKIKRCFFVRELARSAQNGGGFVQYIFDKPGKGLQPKLAYATMIPGTDMWIGTGVYIDNIEAAKLRVATMIDSAVKADTTKIVLIMLAMLLCSYPRFVSLSSAP